MSSLTRRTFLTRLKHLSAVSAVSVGAYGYGSRERHQLSVERHDLPLAMGPQGPPNVRIVSLTDFHYDPLHEAEYFTECVRRTNSLAPDLVMLTGDFVTHSRKKLSELTEILGGIKARHGIFACLGNHDHYDTGAGLIAKLLEKAQVDLLTNRHSRVSVNGGEVVVVGVDSVWSGSPIWSAAASGLGPKDRPIVLMHEPDYVDTLSQDSRVALQLSGHTHGGQIRLPGVGALRLPTYGQRYQAGFYDVRGTKLYVNRGLGTIAVHIRFLCPPEIACFDIRNTDLLS